MQPVEKNIRTIPAGWLVSEKLDGMKARWNGLDALVTRTNKPIYAPQWWIDRLPRIPLEGELYTPGVHRQILLKTTRSTKCPDTWDQVQYHVFDIPDHLGTFDAVVADLAALPESDTLKVVPQTITDPVGMFELVKANGGEGIVARDPLSTWSLTKTAAAIKVKVLRDDEGTVVDTTEGTGNRAGQVAALVLNFRGKIFNLCAGLDTDERQPGHFNTGDTVTFTYRGLSLDGIPQEARYLRPYVAF